MPHNQSALKQARNGGAAGEAAHSAPLRRAVLRDLLLTGAVVGMGVAGSLDQILLHELLQWHVFYTHTSTFWQRFLDGVFHLATVAVLLAGLLGLWRWQAHHARAWRPGTLLAGVLLGAGGFNLFDGTVNHKVLSLHQVREGVANLLPYDLIFLAIAAVVFLAGLLLWRREQARLSS